MTLKYSRRSLQSTELGTLALLAGGPSSFFLQQGFDRGVSDTSLMTRSSKDPVSGVPGMRVNFVRAGKARG